MSHGKAICLHEPPAWEKLWTEDSNKNFVGISDSGLGFQLKNIINTYSPKVLIIDRPIEEVEASLEALKTGLPRTNFCEILHKSLAEFQTGGDIMRVPYHSLNELRTMQKIFWHLTPGEPFDEGRFLHMKDINIQVSIQNAVNFPATHYVLPKEIQGVR